MVFINVNLMPAKYQSAHIKDESFVLSAHELSIPDPNNVEDFANYSAIWYPQYLTNIKKSVSAYNKNFARGCWVVSRYQSIGVPGKAAK